MYQEEIKELVANSLNGFNSCFLFIGPNDAGKTYTLRGEDNHEGIMGKSLKNLFNLMELNQQVNIGNTVKSLYGLKMSVYVVFNEAVHDLIKKNNSNPLQICKYTDKDSGSYFTKIENLQEVEIKNFNDYNNNFNQALQHRKMLSTTLRINDFRKKSNLIISFKLFKKAVSSEKNPKTFEKSQIISQLDFVELASTDYGIDADNIPKHDYFTKATANNFKSLNNNLLCLSLKAKPKFESNLTLALKPTLSYNSQIVLINCVHSSASPPTESYKALRVCFS